MELRQEQMEEINGGAISPTMINAINKILNTIYEFGRQAGSYVKRLIKGKCCPLN